MAATDAALGPLLDPILAEGGAGRTLVVLTSDHGEGLGEHGEATHGVFAYETTLRVPLVLYGPRLFSPRVVAESVRHVDILPTILDALALPALEGLPGRSLLALAQGRTAGTPPPSYFEALTPALTRGWAPLHGVLRDRLKYVELPLPELYDLSADPRELANLVGTRPVPLGEMRTLLGRLRASDAGPRRTAESAEVRERLRSLGYASASRDVARHYGEEDDPKRNIAFESGLEEVIGRYVAGDARTARSLCEDLVRRFPRVPLGLRHLAFLRRHTGDVPGAIAAGRAALAADAGSVEAAAELGHLLSDVGRPQDAVTVLAPYARGPEADLDVLVTYGVALARTGQREASIAALDQARRADPSSALAAYSLGTARLSFGDQGGARAAFEDALSLDPRMARACDSLAVLAAVEGSPDEAERLWKQALAIDPRDPDTLFNLGTLLWRQGRKAEARPQFELFLAVASKDAYAQDIAAVRKELAR